MEDILKPLYTSKDFDEGYSIGFKKGVDSKKIEIKILRGTLKRTSQFLLKEKTKKSKVRVKYITNKYGLLNGELLLNKKFQKKSEADVYLKEVIGDKKNHNMRVIKLI